MRRANTGASWPHLVGSGEHDFDAAVLRAAVGCVVGRCIAAQATRIDAYVLGQRAGHATQVIANSRGAGERYGLVGATGANVIGAAEDEHALGLGIAFPGHALDLVAFTGITGPLTAALTQIASLGPGIKALVGFVGFVVALISLAALRNFGPVLFYVGLAIFAAVGLVIAGAIMGAVV